MGNLSIITTAIHFRQRCLMHGLQQHPHKVNTVTATTSERLMINVLHLLKVLFIQSVKGFSIPNVLLTLQTKF